MVQKIQWNGTVRENTVYLPQARPGFAAWSTVFDYGDGRIGLSFDEVLRGRNDAPAPLLEFGEAAGVPVSYASVECGSRDTVKQRVYMQSADGVHFTETGRCPRDEGSFCHIGFPDGRIIGYDVPKHNEAGTGWADSIEIRESTDGGSTWRFVRHLLKGTAPYLWRVRRLKNGSVLLMASLYGTPWGPGHLRATRNTMLPDETYVNKILTFFLVSEDGIRFSQPCYILPGLGAHEYDMAEMNDGTLLFIAGDVQGTPVGRQFVTPSPDGFIAGPVLPVRKGAPADPAVDPQGGYVPETFVPDSSGRWLLGCRRGKGFSVSGDNGENWYPLDLPGLTAIPYQPVMTRLPDGTFALYGHKGGDNAFGQCDMLISSVLLTAGNGGPELPAASALTLERMLSADRSHYLNAFSARLTGREGPLRGKTVRFRFNDYWNDDGAVNTAAQADAALILESVTDENGVAVCHADRYNNIPDIHLAYNVDAVFAGDADTAPCQGPSCTVLALTPYRDRPYPYDAWMAETVIFLSPALLSRFPDAVDRINEAASPAGLPEDLKRALEKAGIIREDENGCPVYTRAVHAGDRRRTACPMGAGDEYR
ncbi:MAG: hypothetical protein Q4G19_05395 [Clostridia bacterium]|nr:hypothetical protein [Clostridia bacterium]